MLIPPRRARWRHLLAPFLTLCLLSTPLAAVSSQDTVTGAFQGTVTSSDTGEPIAGAGVEIVNAQTGQTFPKTTDALGRWYQGLLHPGVYTIRASAPGFLTKEVTQRLFIAKANEAIPVPVSLDPAPAPPAPTPTPTTTSTTTSTPASTPAAGATPRSAPSPATAANIITQDQTDVRARRSGGDARGGGAFTEEEVSGLPLGSQTFTRTFDELALLLPGVAPPPQTLGSVAGPGVGPGVGSAGQFAANGLRSRGNNFTVDGSDNNDEDIGVRRQGFVALNSQTVESVKEYQAITLLAPAQFGRNIGAQVNAVSKSGGQRTHGSLYGFANSSGLNARNHFDTANGNATTQLTTASGRPVILASDVTLNSTTLQVNPTGARPLTVRNGSGGEDSFTLGQFGFAFGGPLEPVRASGRPGRMFYFVSAEGYVQNAAREESFAVPTVEQRGVGASGATGLFFNPLNPTDPTTFFSTPTTAGGDALLSLFPFANNPGGAYGANTFTQTLPNGARGKIASGKFDANFRALGRQHSLTNRYNFTDDRRDIPAVGGAIFSSLRANVRTQNNSFFFNSELSAPDSSRQIYNQLRLSYGRTRLNFEELRDAQYMLPNTAVPGSPFLLNAPLLENFTAPRRINDTTFGANTGPVIYLATPGQTVQNAMHLGAVGQTLRLGTIGQVNIAGFSPVGTDVFNFPQRRVNNTYQIADELTLRAGAHTAVFGIDTRRSELNSELPRISRPLVTFGGAPELGADAAGNAVFTGRFIRPETFAAASAPSGFFQTLALRGERGIGLRFYQLNFYGQDTWRVSPSLAVSFGLRYEYNTPPREVNRLIEDTFDDPALALVPGLRSFIGNRDAIFDPDRNNFAPRVSVAYSPALFGRENATVVRAGYGRFHDQILGAVVSQSRNVYPSYLTVNFAGGLSNLLFNNDGGTCRQLFSRCAFEFINPSNRLPNITPGGAANGTVRIVQPGTLNNANPSLSFAQLVAAINSIVRGPLGAPAVSGFGATIPAQDLQMPEADHFTFSFEQQLGSRLSLTAAYVGTRGRRLLRFNTPNLGPNAFVTPVDFDFIGSGTTALQRLVPSFFGLTLSPGTRIANGDLVGGRPVADAGTIYRFESTASSRYDALQVQLRTRPRRTLQLQAAYTFSKAEDDVSDVFDLAGASSLPQNSLDLAGERGPANFDVRHRVSYHFVYDLPALSDRPAVFRALFGGVQLAGLGSFHTGQPFTVNSIFDVNLDGNLTDRLNSTDGIVATGDRRRPYQLTVDPTRLLARIGTDGSVGRNSFRASNFFELNLAAVKNFSLGETRGIGLRLDLFNVTNRANYGIPVRFLEAPGFGQSTNTVAPGRRAQLSLKLNF